MPGAAAAVGDANSARPCDRNNRADYPHRVFPLHLEPNAVATHPSSRQPSSNLISEGLLGGTYGASTESVRNCGDLNSHPWQFHSYNQRNRMHSLVMQFVTSGVDNPHHSSGSPGWIVGKGRMHCTAAIDSLQVTTRIEQRLDGEWVTVGTPGLTSRVAPKANTRYTSQGLLTYRKGRFRTAARGSGIYGGMPSGSMTWQYSGR